jgi:hypothetical protein
MKNTPMANKNLINIDLAFYRESQNFKIKFGKVIFDLAKEFKRRHLNENTILDCLIYLNKSSEFLNSGIDLGIQAKGFRYNGIFYGDKGYIPAILAALQDILNRWQHYINRDKEITAKQIDRGIRFLENLLPRKAFDDQVFGTNEKGYTFNLRKYLR